MNHIQDGMVVKMCVCFRMMGCSLVAHLSRWYAKRCGAERMGRSSQTCSVGSPLQRQMEPLQHRDCDKVTPDVSSFGYCPTSRKNRMIFPQLSIRLTQHLGFSRPSESLLGLMLIPLAMLAACSPAPDTETLPATPVSAPISVKTEVAQTAAEAPVLNLRNWTDYMPEGLLADFERETGIKVNYSTYGTNEELEKLVAYKSGSEDLVIPSLNYGGAQAQLGFYQPVNKALLPNYKNLDPVLLQRMETADPGNRFFVPWAWGHTTLFVNKTRVSKALGDLAYPSNEWDLVFKPAYTQRLKSCGIAFLEAPSEIVPLVLQ